jgi:hypothetical protein
MIRLFGSPNEQEIYLKSSRYTDSQIMVILKKNEAGISAANLCHEHGISGYQKCRGSARLSVRFNVKVKKILFKIKFYKSIIDYHYLTSNERL